MSENAIWTEHQGLVNNVFYTAKLNGYRLVVQPFNEYVRWYITLDTPDADAIAKGKTGSVEHAKQIATFAVPQFRAKEITAP